MVGLNEALTNYPSLTHISTVLALFGLSILLSGVLKFPKMAQGLGGTTRNLLLLGVSMVVFFLVCRLLARGTYHAVAHVLEHGVGGGAEQLRNILALSLQMMRVSLRYVGGTLGLVEFALFAWCATGLFSSRFHVVVGKIMAILFGRGVRWFDAVRSHSRIRFRPAHQHLHIPADCGGGLASHPGFRHLPGSSAGQGLIITPSHNLGVVTTGSG